MTPEQEEKFEKWVGEYRESKTYKQSTTFDDIKNGWEACLSANGIGEDAGDDRRFRIGEAIEFLLDNQEGWKRGHVGIIPPGIAEANFNDYRRIPAWKPTDGEAVLTRVMDRAEVGYVSKCFLYVRGNRMPIEQVEDFVPFDDDKIGKPWSKI